MTEEKAEATVKEMRVRHRGRPSEPFAQPNAVGVVCRDPVTFALRVTPKLKTIPAQAFVSWNDGEYFTWERLVDLIEVGKAKA